MSNSYYEGIRSEMAASTHVELNRDPVSRVLKWVLLFTALACFALMTWATVFTYRAAPPIPDRIVAANGTTLFTGEDIFLGKQGFQEADLVDWGGLYGMGSMFGPDYTAANLVAIAKATENNLALDEQSIPFNKLPEDEQFKIRKQMQIMLRNIDLTQSTLTLPDALSRAVLSVRDKLEKELTTDDVLAGYTKAHALAGEKAKHTAEFILYSVFTTVGHRPNSTISWTQNWPYEPVAGNAPTNLTFTWTWVGFCFVFLGFGTVITINRLWLSGVDQGPMDLVMVGFGSLTPSQKKIWKFFLFVAVMFLVQILVGGIMAHYYSERADFYGFPIGKYLPFNFLRSIHLQAPVVWIAFAWIGSGLFLGPIISGKEARFQGILVDGLFYASVLVVACIVVGNYLGIMGYLPDLWFWFGNQGNSYLELGRVWQIIFFAALLMWSWLICRSFWPDRQLWAQARNAFLRGKIRLEHLFWLSTLNIAVLYVFGMIPMFEVGKSYTMDDFWRWWVVHLWVEESFEYFAACATAYLLMGVGLVSRQLAERTVYFQLILIFLGGVMGTGHHMYWAGEPSIWIPLGSMFSFIEVLPLVLLVIESIDQYKVISSHETFKYKLGYVYIIGAAVWNFVGAGVFGGGVLNAPLVNYYEHGTFLTLNHAHTSLFGAFGLLGLGMVYFCLRYVAGDRFSFNEKWGYTAFWMYNAGLVLWTLLTFFPVGWAQLAAVYEHGLTYARSLDFYNQTTNWQWLRIVGDIVFAIGALIMALDFTVKLKPIFAKR
ncbi:nitric-oxide reductase large subunit [Entomobacter blattae]|uniref:Cytochrome C and Quinol oxidase polypeptide I n=1 Tax=Entomobacter blattae TaxID=2762277 RepID=A0A7H1NRA4_9PROT|nr:cbb3-type cytochrome c oxidase subunit I [Entomobacter blattae]QNT78314.1 Cytochrome C and Quinol oxidase polypeptide I [Entomobacter blattae]